ncbi:MAG TPA: hypothetical protein VGK19_13995 [Capsulimonadaceae bacterium]|jgi:hypothetical protein
MSGEYKHTIVAVDPSYGIMADPTTALVVIGSIVAVRAAQAIIEETNRLDKQESVLALGLAESRQRTDAEITRLESFLCSVNSNLLPVDAQSIAKQVSTLKSGIAAARTHSDLTRQASELGGVELAIHRAVQRKSLADANGRSSGSTGRRSQFDSLKQRFAGTASPDGGGGPSDPTGAQAVRRAIAEVAAALQGHDEGRQDRKLAALESAVTTYAATLAESRRQLALQSASTLQLNALIEGLQTDAVLMRWQAAGVMEISALAAQFSPNAKLDSATVEGVLEQARKRAANLVHTANIAQIKADQRDYVANSIRSVMEQMGYMVSGPTPEHASHPASAVIVQGASPSGKAIAVSIPFEGEVWYNVDGFVKSTEAAVGGGDAAVCDEAEEVITQMHEALAEEYHLQMGELQWDGKDPNRTLRQARQQSQSDTQDRSL